MPWRPPPSPSATRLERVREPHALRDFAIVVLVLLAGASVYGYHTNPDGCRLVAADVRDLVLSLIPSEWAPNGLKTPANAGPASPTPAPK